MKANSLSLPHPVLGVSDDVIGEYKPKFEYQLSREAVKIKIQHSLSNDTLIAMIAQNKAKFCVEFNCKKTFYRTVYQCVSIDQEITIDSDLLRDKVDCEFYITASETITDYQINGANSDYSGYIFYVEKGDVLAYGGSTSFLAEKDWQAYKALSSFMIIVRDENRAEGPMEVDLSSEKIVIHLAKKDHDRYSAVRRAENVASVFHSAIVFPTLLFAIVQMMSDEGGSYEGNKWYEVLSYRRQTEPKLKELNWDDPTNIPKIAQIILDNPLSRTLTSIDKMLEMES